MSESTSSSSTSGVSGTVNLVKPMPIPGSTDAPYFNGKNVESFLDALELHADAANIPHTQLPAGILRYCSSKVRRTMLPLGLWDGEDWVMVRTTFIEMYEDDEDEPNCSPEALRIWVDKHADVGVVRNMKEMRRYFREFTQLATPLLTREMILQHEVNLLFYRGLPEELRRKVKKRMTKEERVIPNAPRVAKTMDLVQKEFTELDIDSRVKDVRLRVETDSEEDSSDGEGQVKSKKKERFLMEEKRKAKVEGKKPEIKREDAAVADLARQLQELKIYVGEAIRGSGFQARPLPPPPPNIAPTGQATFPDPGLNQRRCGMCGQVFVHRNGYDYCAETQRLIQEGLVKYGVGSRLVLSDERELPRPVGSTPVAEMIREQARAREEEKKRLEMDLKAKGKVEGRDLPPHMTAKASFAGLQFDGEDVFGTNSLGFSTVLGNGREVWMGQPVTRTQGKREERRYDPAEGKETRKKGTKGEENQEEIDVRGAVKKQAMVKEVEKGKTKEVEKMKPTKSANIPGTKKAKAKESEDVEMDTEMKTPTKQKPKPKASYHFTTDVQEMFAIEGLQEQILKETLITLPLGQLLGVSPELQKRMNGLTKVRREYNDKPVMANLGEFYEERVCECGEVLECLPRYAEEGEAIDTDDEEAYEELVSAAVRRGTRSSWRRPTRGGPVEMLESRVEVTHDSDEWTRDEILERYSSAVKIHKVPVPLFAMVTGKFMGMFGGEKVTFMVDTGSELNICSGELHEATQLPVDIDGTRWALKGINGRPVQLLGCAREVPIEIGGHRFDHHFFINDGGVSADPYEVILGQPFLQWYTASIRYSRRGAMVMQLWQEGEEDAAPSVSISLTSPSAERNKETLVVQEATHGVGCKNRRCAGRRNVPMRTGN